MAISLTKRVLLYSIICYGLNMTVALLNLIKQYGSHSLAFSTIQDTLLYFTQKEGYIAYRYIKLPCLNPLILVLGDPVCDSEIKQNLLSEFIEMYPQALFVHISKQTAQLLEPHHFYINRIGSEHHLYLKSFTPSWNAFKFYKSAVNKFKKTALELRETQLKDLCKKELQHISDEWTSTYCIQKNDPGFLIRPLPCDTNDDVRFFCAYKQTQLIGYRFFYPIFKQETIIGYYADGVRYTKECPKEVSYGLLDYAISTFKKENISYISLGLSPFSSITTSFKGNTLLHIIFRSIYRFGNSIYPFKNISKHKSLFKATQVPVYIASSKRFPFVDLCAVFYATFKNKNPRV